MVFIIVRVQELIEKAIDLTLKKVEEKIDENYDNFHWIAENPRGSTVKEVIEKI